MKTTISDLVTDVKRRIEKHLSEDEAYHERKLIDKWQFLSLEVLKIFSDQNFLWWKNRIYEVQWSKGEIENSERVQLWTAILEAAFSIGTTRTFDENGKPRRSRWFFDIQDDSDEENKDDSDDEDRNYAPYLVY